jgi:circadian clock protein KaiB
MSELCERFLPKGYVLNIINVLEQPEAAEAAKIIATPTLIQRAPPPGRRIIGDLSDRTAVLQALDLEPGGEAQPMEEQAFRLNDAANERHGSRAATGKRNKHKE